LEDKSTNSNDDKKEEDLLSKEELESSSKDVDVLLYGRLIEVEEGDLTRKI
jgi:hypothetical protein